MMNTLVAIPLVLLGLVVAAFCMIGSYFRRIMALEMTRTEIDPEWQGDDDVYYR